MKFADYVIRSFRHKMQHFNPEQYFKMRNKVILSGGGIHCISFSCFTE